MTDEDRAFNGRTILDMCEMGERILDQYAAEIRKISTPPEKYGRLKLVKPLTDAEKEQQIEEERKREAAEELWAEAREYASERGEW